MFGEILDTREKISSGDWGKKLHDGSIRKSTVLIKGKIILDFKRSERHNLGMIKASKSLKNYIESQENIEKFCERVELSKSVVYSLLKDTTPSAETIAKLLEVTGFDFEKAFEVEK